MIVLNISGEQAVSGTFLFRQCQVPLSPRWRIKDQDIGLCVAEEEAMEKEAGEEEMDHSCKHVLRLTKSHCWCINLTISRAVAVFEGLLFALSHPLWAEIAKQTMA